MSIKWTDSQSRAIEERGKSLLVSAAAGSGKTAVLIERIIRIITEEKIDVDRLLIVTFTNAAASEMKEKLIAALNKARDNGDDDGFYRRQLDLISSAHISTFHSFALSVIREHFHLIDIDPGVKIADSQDLELAKWESMDRLFEEEYISGEKSFRDFLDGYSSDRHDYALKEQLLSIYESIMNIPDSFGWLHENVEVLSDEAFLEKKLAECIRDKCDEKLGMAWKFFSLACEMVENAGLEHLHDIHSTDVEKVENIMQSRSFNEMAEKICSIKYETARAAKDEKETWEEIKKDVQKVRQKGKDIVKDLKDKYLNMSLKEHVRDVSGTYGDAVELERLIKRFDEIYKSRKKADGVIDFNDVEHYAIQILSDEKVQKEYRTKFEHIFVDEYQDSNKLQDTLVEFAGREDNLFMVGDLKQSIYKFRLAEPELFRDRYAAYRDDASPLNMKIDLSENFRSKKPVIDAVNGLFSQIMAGYDEDAALKEGSPYEGPLVYPVELLLVDKSKGDDIPEELLEIEHAQLEAAAIAKKIKGELLGSEYVDAAGNVKKMTCRDIVILIRSVKGVADIYQQTLAQYGINSYTDVSEGYFDTPEIEVFLSLLKIIDNYRQDVPLISLMKSPIGGFSLDELIKIRLTDKKSPYFKCVNECAENAEDEHLKNKCAALKKKLEKFRHMAQGIPIDELMWRLMMETGYFAYAGALPGGKQRQANLKALVDKARAFQDRSGGGIYEFLNFIDSVRDKKVQTGQASTLGEKDDVVRIMTIHGSKGLEFPAVFVAGLGKELLVRNSHKRGMQIHKDIGVALTLSNHGEMWYKKTLLQSIIEDRKKEEELEEQIRVLYVALTRARDRLIMVGSVNDPERTIENAECGMSLVKPGTFLDYVLPFYKKAGVNLTEYDRLSLCDDTDTEEKAVVSADDVMGDNVLAGYRNDISDEMRDEISDRLSFVYPHQNDCKMKSKYSVSELNSNRNDSDVMLPPHLNSPDFLAEEKVIRAAQRGTIMHLIMEHLDFAQMLVEKAKGAGTEHALSCLESLVEKELLKPEEADIVKPEDILKFFDTDLGKRAAVAAREGKLFKEREFNMIRNIDGTDVMVQGVIDCCFEEDGEYVLVDYKTNYIDKDNIDAEMARMRDTYSGQIALYRDAIESILGKKVSESYLYLFSIDGEVQVD